MSTNPDWTKDELILALDLYFTLDFAQNKSAADSRIQELSDLLNSLPIHSKEFRGKAFRNTSGVLMKLSNFLRLDPNYSGKGLMRGAKEDAIVWQEFGHDVDRLRRTAKSIRENARIVSESPFYQFEEEFAEGKILTVSHFTRERNSTVIEKKKRQVIKQTGRLACEACAFEFETRYGALGRGFAECHHTIPLSYLSTQTTTRLSDLAVLCANCHRMIHRSSSILTVAELRDHLLK